MTKPFLKQKPRPFLVTFIFLAFLIGLTAIIYIIEHIIVLSERFQQLSTSYAIGILLIFAVFSIFIGWVIYRVVFPKTHADLKTITENTSQAHIETRIEVARTEGLLNQKIEDNFALLNTRQGEQQIYIAMFGEINVGKTAIVSALVPESILESHVIGGSTKTVNQFTWKIDDTSIIISDLPGTDQSNGVHSNMVARQEAIQSHIVIFVCDGDVNRQQYEELLRILALKKPTIVAINKTDQFSETEQLKIIDRLTERLADTTVHSIVRVNSGGFEKVVRIDEDDNESIFEHPIPIDVNALKKAIQNILLDKKSELNDLRDHAVLNVISEQLNVAEQQHKNKQAQQTVQQYTRKAVVGALAAVSPGTDIIIQAYLGTSMVKDICAIYQINISNFDVNTLLKLVQNQIGRLLPLILTITGNALKAFPGVGTLAGGIVHAVAYGMVFDALGKSMVKTLSQQSDLKPAETAKIFQEMLSGNMEKNTTNIIKLVLQEKSKNQ